MEFLMWHVSGKPVGRAKLDCLLEFQHKKNDSDLPTSAKALNRILDKILPVLEPTSHKIKVFPC